MNKLLNLLWISLVAILLVACSDDEPKDSVKEINMFVSSETGLMYGMADEPGECMLVRTDDNPWEWQKLSFNGVQGFSYERGHEYELRVKRTIIANPPADGSDRHYELVRIISDKLVAEPDLPVEDNIQSEADIKYHEGCPINKYSISSGYNVDEDGTITYDFGDSAPSYDAARIWLEDILDKADPNWTEYQRVPYMATYSYIISPLTDKIRLVSNDHNGPLFKDVIPKDEFNYITHAMSPGEELRYALILANVYKKGLQKLEFVIYKTGEVPDKYKFKLTQGALMPFMNEDFGAPAPFDNITYQITDFYDRHQVLGFPEFTQPYDSIVWCADGFPNTVRVYESQNTATSTEEHFSSQWSTHFFRSGEIKNQLKGYRGGEVIYSTSLTTYLYERDFLCYDWVEGSVVLANPTTSGIFCLLDKRYEYQAAHTQETNGTRYADIYVWNKDGLSDEKLYSYQQEALIKLMADNIGQAQNATGKTGLFKCLPSEDVEALKFWENKTTRLLLLHKLPDEEYGLEKYYLHFEAK